MPRKRSKTEIPYKNFWIFLVVLVTFSLLTVFSPLNPSSLTGQTIQEISFLNKGKSLRIFITDIPELESVRFVAKENVVIDELRIVVNDSIPFTDPFLSKFTVSSNQPEKYSRLLLAFKIKESNLLNEGISKEDLKLYHNGKEISFNFHEFNGGYFYFNAETSEMGDFILGVIETS